MSIKIAIDNNIFDKIATMPDLDIKNQLISAIKSKRFSFYPNDILFSELIGLYETKRKDKLVVLASLCLNLMDYRMMNEFDKIIISEIDQNIKEFMGREGIDQVKSVLISLSEGEDPDVEDFDGLLKIIKKQKESYADSYKYIKDSYLSKMKENNSKVQNKANFAEFCTKDIVLKFKKEFLMSFFSRKGIPLSEEKAEIVISKPNIYSYTNLYLKITTTYLYNIIILNKSIDNGDLYDETQLLYANKLDYFVSEEKRLKVMAEYIYDKPKKVIKFSELIELLKKK